MRASRGNMRVLLKFKAEDDIEYDSMNKHTLQGFIYSLLNNTPFKNYHNMKGFKYFSFPIFFLFLILKRMNLKVSSYPHPNKVLLILFQKN